jgi:hypothetical protein
MRSGSFSKKRLAWAVVVAGMAVGVGWWTWIRAKPPAGELVADAPSAFVQITGSGTSDENQVLRERAEMFDPTPLFFPTKWNYGQQPRRPELNRESGQVFTSVEPQFTFSEQGGAFYGASAPSIPVRLDDVLARSSGVPLAGIGNQDVVVPDLPNRAAVVEVKQLGSRNLVLRRSLSNLALKRTDFAPVAFLVVVDAAGEVGEPALLVGSADDVDVFFRNYLVKEFRIGQRLAPGRYQVLVGP